MQPIGQLPPQEWLKYSETVQVMEALMADGKPARFVGGCVRDALLDLPIGDIDIATPEPPEKVIHLLQKAGIRVEPVGIAHGSVLAILPSKTYDITTLRTDVEAFGRHARVSYHDNWLDDATRRDFTMNAIYADLDGTLYDPTGGMDDLKSGRVKFIGDAYDRIREDCLRILRFFRFQAYYGKVPPSLEDLQACQLEAPYLRGLSTERVWYEFKRLLRSPDPAPVLKDMLQYKILAAVFTNPVEAQIILEQMPRLIHLENLHKAPRSAIRRLSCLIGESVETAKNLREDLPLSAHDLEHLVHLTKLLKENPDLSKPYNNYRILFYHGPTLYYDLAFLMAANGTNKNLAESLNYWQHWTSPELPVRGQDLLNLGLVAGPKVGELINDVTHWWLEQACKPSHEQCLQWLQERNKL